MALAPNCVGRVVQVSNACGCTLTRATIDGLTPDKIEALSYQEIALTKAVLDAKEARMLGVMENPLMMLLNGQTKDIKLNTEKIDGEQSIILPYYMRTQRAVINANYFTVVSGSGGVGGVGSNPVSAWKLRLGLGNSPFQTQLQNIERYFLPGATLIVQTWNNVTTRAARTLAFTIVSATNADQGGVPYTDVIVYPPVSAANWVTYTAAQKAMWQPLFGMAFFGANSIANEESYCPQQPSDLSRKILPSWMQTIRESYCRDSEYEKVLGYILGNKVNDYQKGFKWQSIADQQKQQKVLYDKAFFNTVFYGMAIDVDNQTLNGYRSLPAVYDVKDPSCVLSYKARLIGIFGLLDACNRVRDFQGARLDLDMLFSDLYYLRRWREATSESVRVIDGYTDRFTAGSVFETMTKYYKARYGWETTRYAKMGEKITHEGMLMFVYDEYDIKEAGVTLALFQLDYFNDLVDAYATTVVGWNFSTRANNIWFIDWSDIKLGVDQIKQVTRRSPNPNTDLADYQCVISPVTKTYDLRSKMATVLMDVPNRHLIYHNFASGCAHITIPGCTVPQS